MPESSPLIDNVAFEQLVELDDEGSTEFLQEILSGWRVQIEEYFGKMDNTLAEKDLGSFWKLANFIEVPTHELGAKSLFDTLQTLQYLGQLRDEKGLSDITEEEALALIPPLFERAIGEYKETYQWFSEYLKEKGVNI